MRAVHEGHVIDDAEDDWDCTLGGLVMILASACLLMLFVTFWGRS